jgi:hypothetical protein
MIRAITTNIIMKEVHMPAWKISPISSHEGKNILIAKTVRKSN